MMTKKHLLLSLMCLFPFIHCRADESQSQLSSEELSNPVPFEKNIENSDEGKAELANGNCTINIPKAKMKYTATPSLNDKYYFWIITEYKNNIRTRYQEMRVNLIVGGQTEWTFSNRKLILSGSDKYGYFAMLRCVAGDCSGLKSYCKI